MAVYIFYLYIDCCTVLYQEELEMKPSKFFLTVAGINLILFIIIYFMPYNPIRSVIGYLTSLFVFIIGFGIKVAVVSSKDACVLATTTGNFSRKFIDSLSSYQSYKIVIYAGNDPFPCRSSLTQSQGFQFFDVAGNK